MIDKREMQFLYRDGDDYVFMDNSTYDQLNVAPVVARRRASNYLVESADAILQMYGDEIVGVDLPAAVELTIAETEPGVQGDRVSGARKPATLETGLVVQVPLFVEPRRPRQGRHPHRRVPHPGVSPSDGTGDSGDSGDDDLGPFPGSRREARERAFHLLYEAETKGEGPAAVLASLPLAPDAFTVELVHGVGETYDGARRAHLGPRPQLGPRPDAGARPRPAAPRHLRAGPPARRAHRRGHLRGGRAGQARTPPTTVGRFVNGVLSAVAAEVRPAS